MSTDLPHWPEAVARKTLPRVDSTMSEASRMAPHQAGPVWILAHEQTAGHGRRGRPWIAPAGNFSASYLFRPGVEPAQAALYSFVTALALDEALCQVAGPQAHLAIKWPNDVLLNGGKVSGILLETIGQGPEAWLCIGVGVNLAGAPPVTSVEPGAIAPVSLRETLGFAPTPDEFLAYLAPAFERFATQFRTYGFAPIRTAWLARAARIGTQIRARTGTETHEGIFETIDESGAMILAGADGRMAISAADIFF
ncbi:biotin--[acetyl-CoA-carboxylase] ligase [Thioclava litoralis]|uniref:biotin--[biotin carboxyl-carrier protein] ligase n=1 Tax=Thioclava litoralis TaxID=3076557 RepID=A0ABZ1DYR0_9RHOB|nr:biotin--[acetyl-CoA-carboxylase] ligase [Thioclava sp. FTW29]